MILMANIDAGKADKDMPAPAPNYDRRKVRRSKTNDTHMVYKTRVRKVLDYMVAARPVDKRSVQAVRSATGVSYIFIMALVRAKFLMIDRRIPGDVPAPKTGTPARPSRRHVAVTDTGRLVHSLLKDIDSVMDT